MPALHDACDVRVVERQLARTQRVDERPARGVEIAIVARIELVVLVLLDALAVAPARPELLGGHGRRLRLQERPETWRVASAQVEDRAEDVERQRMDEAYGIQRIVPYARPRRVGCKRLTRLPSVSVNET